MSSQINDEEGWGWDALGEDEPNDSHTDNLLANERNSTHIPKSNSDRSLHGRKGVTSNNAISGITSSPSFQELEKAIGATLALNFAHGEESIEQKSLSPNSSFSASRLSSTNLTQQKVLQQRMRQFHNSHRNMNNYYRHHTPNSSTSLPAKVELAPYINESESRALILFHSPTLTTNTIRDACSKFGVLYYIRPEFHHRGVTFLSYFDLQAATNAKESIASAFATDSEASAHYSVMLHATNSNTEEFRLVVKNLPNGGTESDVQSIFSRYGQLRCIEKTFGSGLDLSSPSQDLSISYSIEYFNIQDARLAASELSATSASIWGPDVSVKFAPLDERKQQLCRQLLATLSRWRSEIASTPVMSSPNPYPIAPSLPLPGFPPMVPIMNQMPPTNLYPVNNAMVDLNLIPPLPYFQPNLFQQGGMLRSNYFSYPTNYQSKPESFPINYSNSTDVPNQNYYGKGGFDGYDKFNNETGSNPRATMMPHVNPHFTENSTPYSNELQEGMFQIDPSTAATNSKGNRKGRAQPTNERSDFDFALDLDRILNGSERRTTIMVRNIPNKYSQQMLLEEVNQKHSGTYDFFYLPIDFKNRCNVGYCFINFLDPKFIPAFVEDFNGQRWRSFNSEKVCAITFARIQGKSAMISRFQNSSLLEKDDEYKPLLFYSNGPDAGKPEPFPVASVRPQRSSTTNGETVESESRSVPP